MEPVDDNTEHLIARALNLVEHVNESPRTERLRRPRPAGTGPTRHLSGGGRYQPSDPAEVDRRSLPVLQLAGCPDASGRPRTPRRADVRGWATGQPVRCSACRATPRVEWVPMHVTINRIELEGGVYGGLVTLRLPTEDELPTRRPRALERIHRLTRPRRTGPGGCPRLPADPATDRNRGRQRWRRVG